MMGALILAAVLALVALFGVTVLLRKTFTPMETTAPPEVPVSADTLEAESIVDQRMLELHEAQEQSLKGMKLDVMAELAKPRPPSTPIDVNLQELQAMAKQGVKK